MASQRVQIAAGVLLSNRNGVLTGYDVRETSGSAAASVKVYQGVSVIAANLVADIGILANDSKDINFPEGDETQFMGGLFVVLTGAVEGLLKWRNI